MSEQEIDTHLDAVLRASGSALKNYSMPATIARMRTAMRDAIDVAGNTPKDDADGLSAVYDLFGIGSGVREPHILLENARNAMRRAQCLRAIEREFFTFETPPDPDEDGDEPGEECLLNWGHDPDEYVKTFRAALARIAAPPLPPERMFPIMRGRSFPWSVIAPFEHRAKGNHGQSLDQLARRGGLGTTEALAVLRDVEYDEVPERGVDAVLALEKLVAERLAKEPAK